MQPGILTIVGTGLIGGSLGLAAKKRGLVRRVIGIGRQQASLEAARAVGAIDEGFVDPAPGLDETDLVVFCTPVDRIAEQVLAFAPLCQAGTLFTDAGSTKGDIVRAIEGKLPGQIDFVGSHPLAGSEKKGASYADADLFEGRVTVVTPTPRTNGRALEKIIAFWKALGSRVTIMTPDEHDKALAVTSHLPHLVAAALVSTSPTNLHHLVASGFRDTTRIAAGDPELWTAICSQNRDAILEALMPFSGQLQKIMKALQERDWPAIQSFLNEAKKVRDALGS